MPLNSGEFQRLMELLCDAHLHPKSRIEVLTNGEQFYEAELEAMRKAKHSINLEAYIFQKGKVTRRFLEVLTDRAKAGVQVRLVLDAIGSFASWNSYFADLTAAGGKVQWYHGFRWLNLFRLNNRTHRELLIVDGEVGFIGGAGFGDHWLISRTKMPRWRDTMFRVTGEAVSGLQATFAENWLEASEEILTDPSFYECHEEEAGTTALVINSSPAAGRATRARILFQTLFAAARESIHITTPYFLPDKGVRDELVRAIKERGVKVRIVVPGRRSDHLLTRRSSRRLYGDLLKAGAEIYEYEPAMIHTKSLIVDGMWSVIGSTNMDPRSFGLNNEVNLAACSESLAARLQEDFARDMAASRQVNYKEWKRRPVTERFHEWFGWLLERQQ